VLIDAREVSTGAEFACDLCVVGAGPAGIAIADRLRDSGLSVVLLESGARNVDLPSQRLYCGEIRGHGYYRLDACRWRLFGGGTTRWGGWCRPLEAVDFTARGWLPYSGWPITAQALQPYEADAARLFELPNARFDLDAWRHRLPDPLPLDASHFEHVVFQHSPETDFGQRYGARLFGAANITTMLYANLTQIRLAADSPRVSELQVGTLTGRQFTVRPKAVVLAAGAIENARLLLASGADRPGGLGNEYDMVGRCFMEHLHVVAGHLLMSVRAGNNDFCAKTILEDVRLRGVITPTGAALDRYRLLATSIAVENPSHAMGTPFVGWPPAVTFPAVRWYRTLRQGRLKPLANGLKILAQRAQMLRSQARTWNLSRRARSRALDASSSDRIYSLYFRAEQAPDPANRVTLTERRDALGLPQTRLEWRVNPLDIASITGWLAVLDRDVRARGLGQVIGPPEDWQRHINGGPHHMGTTRMSADPRHGVVDADCRVHSVENLYVAGSSVFATGGYANPTFALVTLALRLADMLRRRLQATPQVGQ
jgi:choline dehydrogenase-like flavoprotein